MATISIDNFGGIAPRIHPTLLGANMATRAHNCILKSGKLVPIKQPSQTALPVLMVNDMASVEEAKTIYIWHMADGQKRVLAWPGKVYVTESNLSTDPNKRLFVTGETGVGGSGADGNHPCVYMDTGDGRFDAHDLCKDTIGAPVVGTYDQGQGRIIDHVPADEANIKYTYFFQSWVDKYGYESGLSGPSREVQYNSGDVLDVDAYANAPQGAAKRRFYFAAPGAENTYVLFIAEQDIPEGQNYFPATRVRMDDDAAGEQEPGIVAPPEDLEMVVKLPGNFYAGVRRSNPREVRFSEIGNPSNWPDEYVVSITDDIIGLGVTLNTVFAVTKSFPWAITGAAPEEMVPARLASDMGCASADSICLCGGRVFYAGHTGICMLSDGAAAAAVITESVFSKREWQALGPKGCRMCAFDDALYCFFNASEALVCAIGGSDSASASVTTNDESAQCVCFDREEDRMYFIRSVG